MLLHHIPFNLFVKYAGISVMNTVLHWTVFFVLYSAFTFEQSWSNFFAYLLALSFSFFVNARLTFECKASIRRYSTFVAFMLTLSFVMGELGEEAHWAPLLTLSLFSFLSLVMGFTFALLVVFKER